MKKIREIKYYFKIIIKFVDYKSLFDEIIDNKYYYIDNLLKRILLFD